MNKLIAVVLVAMTAHNVSAELLENGDFSRKMAYWDLAAPADYGPKPAAQLKDKVLELSSLHTSSAGYLTINQAVDIRSNRKYRLSFEVRGEPSGEYLVTIQDPGKGSHFAKLLQVESSWKQEVIEFSGAYDTDSKWVKAWLKGMRDTRLEGGQTINQDFQSFREPKGEGPVRSWLTFAIGKLPGNFSIRTISLMEKP